MGGNVHGCHRGNVVSITKHRQCFEREKPLYWRFEGRGAGGGYLLLPRGGASPRRTRLAKDQLMLFISRRVVELSCREPPTFIRCYATTAEQRQRRSTFVLIDGMGTRVQNESSERGVRASTMP